MKRRTALRALAAAPLLARGPGTSSARFRQRLAELGYIEDKNILIDMRFADGDAQRLQQLARDFVASGVDIIVSPGVAASVAARQATGTIPIVMLHAGNPAGTSTSRSRSLPS